MENPNIWTYLYYVSYMIIAVAAAIGIWQLFIMKHDSKIRYKRASIEYSLRLIEHFCEKPVKIMEIIEKGEEKENIPIYKGTVENLPAFDTKLVIKRLEKLRKYGFENFTYNLEYISAGVLSGLCDEDLIFETIGRIFCFFIAQYYDIYKSLGSIGIEFKYTIELFDRWRKRIKRTKLELEKIKLSDKEAAVMREMHNIVEKKIPIIK